MYLIISKKLSKFEIFLNFKKNKKMLFTHGLVFH